MELKKENIEELRKLVEDQLQDVPYGQRIHLNKDLLEELLFETITCNKETGEKIRLPIWSGEFLRKIDLSEISFDNVAWSLLTAPYCESSFSDLFDEETNKKFDEGLYDLSDGQMVDYSHTNAKIDLSKSWEAKHGEIVIDRCNFSGLDLSNCDMSKLDFVYESNLSNTGIVLSPNLLNKSDYCMFIGTDLSGVDLSEIVINGENLVGGGYFVDGRCNLSNTGINITFKNEDIKNPDPDFVKKLFHDMVKKGFLVGCYLNGKKIHSPEESQEIKSKNQEGYKKKLILRLTKSIQEQISGSGRK